MSDSSHIDNQMPTHSQQDIASLLALIDLNVLSRDGFEQLENSKLVILLILLFLLVSSLFVERLRASGVLFEFRNSLRDQTDELMEILYDLYYEIFGIDLEEVFHPQSVKKNVDISQGVVEELLRHELITKFLQLHLVLSSQEARVFAGRLAGDLLLKLAEALKNDSINLIEGEDFSREKYSGIILQTVHAHVKTLLQTIVEYEDADVVEEFIARYNQLVRDYGRSDLYTIPDDDYAPEA